ncbi:galactokinase [Sansalvadorimonas sp. 2012CJ34-2]|uniref:Galactokinase n=1 Tax=Parendozoicomonas callyspongiae TaxID=2942213 RepID=A0ABT0PC27_9GAMM|nr:galactokinase [Sansalvadorimonas sp. 2012CJ34-2]MCL6268938.1 galactokinase [Sansalvadorimonas sp. 2012CJ34-2]
MKTDLQVLTSQTFQEQFGSAPKQFYWAPGRVNLIGEHTDYNDGFVLPCAINYGTVIAASPRDDNKVVVVACDYENARSQFELTLPVAKAEEGNFWCNYIRGTAQALMQKGHQLKGANLVVSGNVPQGAGLSSSAALEVVSGLALSHLSGIEISPADLALAGQSSENDFVGSNTGIMDQMISACGKENHAMLLDCRSLDTMLISMPAGVAVVIINSNVQRGLVDSEYNTRRKQCESAAAIMGVQALRDADMSLLEEHKDNMDSTTYRRARHVITENIRTMAASEALSASDLAQMGELMAQSHISMRDDFEITHPAIDALVEIVDSAITTEGGVRMTGGGFGGCIVALVPEQDVPAIRKAVEKEYEKRSGLKADIHICKATSGATVLS